MTNQNLSRFIMNEEDTNAIRKFFEIKNKIEEATQLSYEEDAIDLITLLKNYAISGIGTKEFDVDDGFSFRTRTITVEITRE